MIAILDLIDDTVAPRQRDVKDRKIYVLPDMDVPENLA